MTQMRRIAPVLPPLCNLCLPPLSLLWFATHIMIKNVENVILIGGLRAETIQQFEQLGAVIDPMATDSTSGVGCSAACAMTMRLGR